ncbi:MAG: isoprenoid biosynthesis glyoxalase ElbB [Thermoanaerobaculum sp.]|nr:isoprenoid biosynthesis glyoxalase ElbB [Thermoanaerobaculum sp.]MDW7967781.1 isoprenoid biosynthesis glyoxalase ElbB [Thermoanaerobaculum sp.]
MSRIRVGVLLSGCGVYDGAEIHEAVITLLALDRAGVETLVMAPNVEQLHVINHLTGDVVVGETRNVLQEAARIARGNIRDLATVEPQELDALILPGGFGAAKNLCDFALKGANCQVHPEVARVVRGVHALGRPIGAICIAPALVAKLLGEEHPTLTIGTDRNTAAALEAMGACHQDCAVEGVVVDEKTKVVSTPAYMLARSIAEAAAGIEKLVAEVVRLAAPRS